MPEGFDPETQGAGPYRRRSCRWVHEDSPLVIVSDMMAEITKSRAEGKMRSLYGTASNSSHHVNPERKPRRAQAKSRLARICAAQHRNAIGHVSIRGSTSVSGFHNAWNAPSIGKPATTGRARWQRPAYRANQRRHTAPWRWCDTGWRWRHCARTRWHRTWTWWWRRHLRNGLSRHQHHRTDKQKTSHKAPPEAAPNKSRQR